MEFSHTELSLSLDMGSLSSRFQAPSEEPDAEEVASTSHRSGCDCNKRKRNAPCDCESEQEDDDSILDTPRRQVQLTNFILS